MNKNIWGDFQICISVPLSESNGTRTHNHLVCQWTLHEHSAKLAKWLNCVVRTYLHRAFDMITYSQMHHTDKYALHSSIIWPVKESSCGFESRCCHLLSTVYRNFWLHWHSTVSSQLFIPLSMNINLPIRKLLDSISQSFSSYLI